MRTHTGITLLGISIFLLGACAAPSSAPPAVEAPPPQAVAVEAATPDEQAMEGQATVAQTTTDDAMAESPAEQPTMEEQEGAATSPGDETVAVAAAPPATAADAPPAPAIERPAWQQIALTDARTGQPFTLADFAGKTVFVEPFATWCTNCRQQLGNVQAARTQLGDDVVFVTLSVEPNIGDEALRQYQDETGFDWTFAAMPPELLQALAGIFGQTVANPPATPHFIIRPDGSVTALTTGIEAPEALVAAIAVAQGE